MCDRSSSDKNRHTAKEQSESYRQEEPQLQEIYKDPYESPLLEERYEIIAGIRYDLKPSPGVDHQLLVTKLTSELHDACKRSGIVIVAPMDVQLDDQNILQPDVIFISTANMDIIHGQTIQGPPDLVLEILSPHSGKHDKIRKKAVYERYAVPEYWIVDPQHETIDQFMLKEKKYELHGTYSDEHTLTSPQLNCINIDLQSLFQEKLQYRKS